MSVRPTQDRSKHLIIRCSGGIKWSFNIFTKANIFQRNRVAGRGTRKLSVFRELWEDFEFINFGNSKIGDMFSDMIRKTASMKNANNVR